ncbi:sodium/proline symporter [Pullulanibacillus pueri]|uniref:Sodium/proline symporter n=1 Tax=Pullulanibacillus pueri TaxID=1437324 RepID=A0A8J2ZS02_9BACL|nr:sodium/proline symporter PutP [Pullulanibacillus pueri]MBM7679958.1 sodium/proline symporter [Pullulanibacillus pueri]GGH73669.1 sodium:proline symporter [Pullulanibacillus pueri]
MQGEVIVSLSIYMIAMLAIGYYSYRRTTNISDYMLAGRGLGPAVTALSAGASDMSGWMLMGLPGAMYASGLSSAWLSIGLCIGAYCNYLLLAPRFRVYTEIAEDSITIPDYLENRFQDRSNLLRLVSGLVILVFFTLYVSSGMVSGGTLFESAFGLNYTTGLLVTVAVVVCYTLFGGFLAVSMTDFVQGCIMFVALILVPIVALTHVGGTHTMTEDIRSINPHLLNLFTGTSVIGILSLIAWGLGYFGQPHIIVRFMAIKSTRELRTARRIGMSWMIISIIGAMAVGLIGISYFSHHGGSLKNPETVFIEFADILFNPLITGFILAAVLAAIMSTISSQLLVSSSAVTEDFYKTFFRRSASDKELVFIGRGAVLLIALIAIGLSYTSQSILDIVSHAWAGFGSAFGPVILLSLYWKRMTRWGALAGMMVGGLTVIFWLNISHLPLPHFMDWAQTNIYEMIPGFILGLIALIVVSLLTKAPEKEVSDQFAAMQTKLKADLAPSHKTKS